MKITCNEEKINNIIFFGLSYHRQTYNKKYSARTFINNLYLNLLLLVREQQILLLKTSCVSNRFYFWRQRAWTTDSTSEDIVCRLIYVEKQLPITDYKTMIHLRTILSTTNDTSNDVREKINEYSFSMIWYGDMTQHMILTIIRSTL